MRTLGFAGKGGRKVRKRTNTVRPPYRQGSDMRRPGQVVGSGLQCPCKADEGNERDVVLIAFDHSHVGGMTRDAFAKLFLCQVQGQTALANSRTQAACSG